MTLSNLSVQGYSAQTVVAARPNNKRFWNRRKTATLGLMPLALVVLGLFPPKESFDQAKYRKIRNGLSESEVHTILGCSPGNYGGVLDAAGVMEEFHISPKPAAKSLRWTGHEMAILVDFDERGLVIGKQLYLVNNDTGVALVDGLQRWAAHGRRCLGQSY